MAAKLRMQQVTVPVEGTGFTALVTPDGELIPFEFSGWKEETEAFVKTAYLAAAISESWFPYTVKGPHANDFMASVCTNNFENAPVGKSKHAMILTPGGTISGDGVVLRVAEDEWLTTCLYPIIDFYLDQAHARGEFLDVVGTDESRRMCLYQVGGPKSLEILERATGQDLHDIEYLHFRNVELAGKTVRIFRLGMAGTLAYEVHCDFDGACDVYNAILAAGQDYGIVRQAYHAYMMNHTENGFEQASLHFMYDYTGVEGLLDWVREKMPWFESYLGAPAIVGSETDARKAFFVSPYDIGWGYLVSFKHDFPGKEACLAKKADHLECVTLEWNAEDIAKVYQSQFDGSECPYMPMDDVNDFLMFDFFSGKSFMHADKVLNGAGEQVGISSGRGQIAHYHRMISLASVEPAYAAEGTELKVLWGSPEHPQIEIRAKVAQFPYIRLPLNADFDVSKVPHGNR